MIPPALSFLVENFFYPALGQYVCVTDSSSVVVFSVGDEGVSVGVEEARIFCSFLFSSTVFSQIVFSFSSKC